METMVSESTLLEKVKKITPLIRKYSFEAEENRKLSGPVIDALKDAGFFRIWKPKAYGGLETDPVTAMQAFEALARIDSSVSWNVMASSAFDSLLSFYPDEALATLFSTQEEAIMAGSWYPPGRAVPVNDGYNVSGHWTICSGCDYASWFGANIIVMEGDQPRRGKDGNAVVLDFFVPAENTKILDTWDAIGMRGTGSHDVQLDNVFVPHHLTAPLVPIERAANKAYQGPLYRNTIWLAVSAIVAPALGIARAAIDDTLGLIKNKIPNYTATVLKDLQRVQMKLAEAEAILSAARAGYYENIKWIWETAQQDLLITLDQKMKLNLAAIYAIQSAVKTVAIVHNLAGLTGMRASHPIQRHFRDINTLRQHAFTSRSRYQACGQLMLGLKPDWEFFYL